MEYQEGGTTVAYSRTAAYNKRGEVSSDSVSQRDAAGKVTVTSTTYDYKLESSSGVYAGAYAGGTVTHQHSTVTYNGAAQPATDTKNTITWYDAAEIGGITYKPNSTTTYTTTNHYDGLGRLAWSHIADGRPREVSFLHDSEGRVLQRVEKSAAASNPQDWHYFVAGRQIGSLTNNNDLNSSYGDVIYHRSWAQGTGPFAYGDTAGLPGGDFDQSYDAIRPGVGGWADGDYTATGGETLAQVADTLWGDAGLWYLLAQTNGLGGDGGNCERAASPRAARVEIDVGRRVHHDEQQPDHGRTIGAIAKGACNRPYSPQAPLGAIATVVMMPRCPRSVA